VPPMSPALLPPAPVGTVPPPVPAIPPTLAAASAPPPVELPQPEAPTTVASTPTETRGIQGRSPIVTLGIAGECAGTVKGQRANRRSPVNSGPNFDGGCTQCSAATRTPSVTLSLGCRMTR
jgi:hypothetical protein